MRCPKGLRLFAVFDHMVCCWLAYIYFVWLMWECQIRARCYFRALAAWQAQKAHFDVCYAGYFSPTWPTWRFWGLSRYSISRKVRRGSRLFFKPLFLSPFITFLRRFGRKTGIDFAYFGLDMVFEGTTGVCEPIHRFISKWVRKKEKYANSKCIRRVFVDLKVHNVQKNSYHFDCIDQ